MKEITIKATMSERWVNDFCSMLKYMEICGRLGHSAMIGFYANGYGDFRPKFEFSEQYVRTDGIPQNKITDIPEILFDAG